MGVGAWFRVAQQNICYGLFSSVAPASIRMWGQITLEVLSVLSIQIYERRLFSSSSLLICMKTDNYPLHNGGK